MPLPKSERPSILEAAEYIKVACGVSLGEAREWLEREWQEGFIPFIGGDGELLAPSNTTINWQDGTACRRSPLGDGGHYHYTVPNVRVSRALIDDRIFPSNVAPTADGVPKLKPMSVLTAPSFVRGYKERCKQDGRPPTWTGCRDEAALTYKGGREVLKDEYIKQLGTPVLGRPRKSPTKSAGK